MPHEPPRLFLSYGVRDASELAERLNRDLAARGYQVWQDVRRLRAGRPWDEDVPVGLRNSQVLLALLSPQSVRRARDAGNPTATDSVCLDEIAYARGALNIPIVSVQVVSCEAPFLVYRLHQIDFRRWRESEVTYQAGLTQICAGIEAALRGETPERHWRPSLEPWDFAPFLLEKRNHFTGREWLFRDVDEWRRKDVPPALLITGEPGIGKSAVVAALVGNNPEGQVLAYHCCRADTPATLEPVRFVRSLAGMLAARIEGYAAMLEDPGIKDALERVDTDPASAFEGAILGPLHKVPKPDGNRRYLLIDALDEALAHSKRPTIVDVLGARLRRMPSWLGIVATTRGGPDVLSKLRGLPAQTLEANDPKNQDDVRAFLKRRLSEPSLRAKAEAGGKTLEELTTALLRSSAYNFLFVATALEAVETGQFRFDEIEKLPPGLSSLYEVFFDRLFREVGVFQLTRPVLEILTAAREPLTQLQIAACANLDAEKELPPLLGRLAAFVPVREGRYSLFHRSLFEWLTGWDAQQQPLAGSYHLSLKDGHKRLAGWGWAEYQRGVQNASLYCLRHLVAHLHEADRNDQARMVLLDFEWLQAKLAATDTNALIADYARCDLQEGALQRLERALSRSAHILAQDPGQLPSQLFGRLLSTNSPELLGLLEKVRFVARQSWLRPLTASLASERSIHWLRPAQGESLSSVVFSPNGLWAAHATSKHEVVLWNLKEWKAHGTLFSARNHPYALALSDDARWCLFDDSLGGVYRWGAVGDEIWEGRAHRQLTIAELLAISANGGRALSACQHGRMVAWDIDAGRHEILWDERDNRVLALSLDAAGNSAVAARVDGSVDLLYLWPARQRALFKLNGEPSAIARSSNNTVVAAATTDGRIELRSVDSPEPPIAIFSAQERPTSVAISSDHRYLAVGTADGTVEVWNIARGARSALYRRAHTYKVERIVFSYDGAHVVSADYLQIKEWALEVADEEEQGSIGSRAAGQVKVTVDGLRAVAMLEDGGLGVWNIRTGALESVLPPASRPAFGDPNIGPSKGIALATKAPRILSWNEKLLCVWDLEAGVSVGSLSAVDTRDAAITPDGARVVYVNGLDITLWRPDEGKSSVLGSYKGDRPDYVAISPDGQLALSSGGDRKVIVWSLSVRRKTPGDTMLNSYWPDARGKPATVAFTGPEEAIVTTGDGSLFVVDMRETESEPKRLEGRHAAHVDRVLVSRDGKLFVTSSGDGTVKAWDLGTRRSIFVLDAHPGCVEQLSVSAQRVLLHTRDGVLKIVSLRDGSLLNVFQGDKQIVTCAADAELQWVVARDQGGQMHFLHVEAGT